MIGDGGLAGWGPRDGTGEQAQDEAVGGVVWADGDAHASAGSKRVDAAAMERTADRDLDGLGRVLEPSARIERHEVAAVVEPRDAGAAELDLLVIAGHQRS